MTLQPIELESCSNHLWIKQIFLVRLKKNFSFWIWGSLRGDVTSGCHFCIFGLL